MPVQVIAGAQWGDEGKGKLTDALAAQAALVVRAQGGNNAGHTVVVDGETYKLHLLPSGILHPTIPCLITDGVAVNPIVLLAEIQALEQRGISCSHLGISPRCHLILPYHIALDEGQEASALTRIGTTKRGNGPVFADKMSRLGIRLGQLFEEAALYQALAENLTLKNPVLREVYGHPGFVVDKVMEELLRCRDGLLPYIRDPHPMIHAMLEADAPILVEGAQGVLLDINFDMYPYVTSSHPGPAGAALGTGIPPTALKSVTGVVKAYTTRVGAGPFPTEFTDATADTIRERGHEYGTTTGRPRRIGWLDLVLLRYAVRCHGFTELCLTKVDVMDALDEIPVCVEYRRDGHPLTELPHTPDAWSRIEPVYEVLPGWQSDTSGLEEPAQIPAALEAYIHKIEEFCGVPVRYLSCGPSRTALVERV